YMAKNYSNRNRKRKALIAMLCALSVSCTGLAAACAPNNEENPPSTAVTAKEDTQLLKNGNFEHFDIPDKAVHLIKNVNSWSLNGDTSVKSGIIGTSKSDWDKLTDPDLAGTLDYNNDLSTSNEDYVNYNSMRSRDILYKDTYAATLADDKVEDSWVTKHDGGYAGYFGITGTGTAEDPYKLNGETVYYSAEDKEFYLDEGHNELVRKALIANPGTHYGNFTEVDGKYYYGSTQVYADDKGNYYVNEDKETDPVGNVLMIHNAGTDTINNGIQQYYSSNSITLEAHTSAEISLWVKTSDLRFDKGYIAGDDETDKGAYIEVVQTVAGSDIDSFKIKAINTQNIVKGTETDSLLNNGWVQYTVYVNACDFADTTIQLKLGLGGSENNEKVTGYAFFDDVQVKKYRTLGEDSNYDKNKVEKTTCYLTSDEEDKIFHADGENAKDFHYLIDLTSIKDGNDEHTYQSVPFGKNVKVGLTTEKNSKGVEYAATKNLDKSKVDSLLDTKDNQTNLKLPKDVKERPTKDDIIKVITDKDYKFDNNKYSEFLNNLTGEKGATYLPGGAGSSTLVMFSAWGTPYTATISNTNFKLNNDGYLLVSFWVKTSDMGGETAATVKIYEYKDAANEVVNEDSVQTLTIDTTNRTTDFEGKEDIYNGWVQCFFFVKNTTDADEKTFNIDFSFGVTEIAEATSFESGYAAIAKVQTLTINEDIYNLASENDTTKLFSFKKTSDKDGGTAFDEATGVNNVNEGIATPDSYTWANGGKNVLGSLTDTTANKNVFLNADEKLNAGLINRDSFKDYSYGDEILKSFLSTAEKWDDVFGKNCYQPLIIVNNLREYAVKAEADKTTYKNYYTYDESTRSYVKVGANDEYNENATYYSLSQVVNNGFMGKEKTVSSNGREVISVRVKVTGDAVAYIYLVDSDDTDEVLSFTTPSYTFWYDEEGNVLREELKEDWTTAQHREHIIYTLREDGLYDGKDGKLYGNQWNLVKSYKDSKYEGVEYYDKNGKVPGGYDTVYENDGETYYKEDGTIANHYLCTTDGTHVYEYIDGKYYYVEITTKDGKTTEVTNTAKVVENFDEQYARYSNPDIDEELLVKVTESDCTSLGDEKGWVTVNFVISAGSEEKSYRLALWSGDRKETGIDENGNYKSGAIAFDYSHATVDEKRLAAYENEIINAYNSAIIEVSDKHNEGKKDEDKVDLFKGLASGTDVNIRSYEKLVAGLDKEYSDDIYKELVKAGYVEYDSEKNEYKPTYTASYYTYTLYDSAAFVPFNATTAGDGETGYNYDASSFSEQLAYFAFDDEARSEKNIFVDYTAVDQSISKNTVDNDDKTDDEDTPNNSAELGLYISSIVLVVVLLITLVSILVTQYIKKRKKTSGPKNSNKNVYRKRDRYVKKLHLVKDEMVEPENAESDVTEVPAEDVTPAENEVTEAPVEESEAAEPTETVETAEPAETATPAEETTEAPAEKPEGEDKE
ncbi:MAG: hypothetical protein K2K38_04410, partial [Clostridia bacterium]|nr:hypothetical protein [Clostridia bacterium]